jgi:hypothetical protein
MNSFGKDVSRAPMAIQFLSVVPVLRIFDVAKADAFYQGLGSSLRRQRAALPAGVATSSST